MNTRITNYIFLCIVGIQLTACDLFFDEEKALQQAEIFQQDNKQMGAIFELKKVLDKNPSNQEARILLGKSYIEIEQGMSAEKELEYAIHLGVPKYKIADLLAESFLLQHKYKKVIDELPLNVAKDAEIKANLMLLHGYAYLGLDKNDKAKNLFELTVANNHKPTETYMALARYYMKMGKPNQAFEFLEKSLAADQANIKALLLKGQILLSSNKSMAAQQSFREIISISSQGQLNSTQFQARVYLTQIAIFEKKYADARREVDALVRVAPNHPASNYLSALVSYQEKKYNDAETSLKKILAVIPDDLKSKLLLGAVSYAKHNYEQANKHLSYFVDKVPTHIPAQKLLAIVKIKLGRDSEVYESLSPFIDKGENDTELLTIIGKAALSGNRPEEAIGYLRRAQKENPANTELRTELAKAYMAKGAYDDAIAELKGISGKDALQAKSMLVYAQLKKGELNKARDISRQLIVDYPDNPVVYSMNGTVELVSKNTNAAENYFLKALEVEPKFIPAMLAMAKILLERSEEKNASQYYERVLQTDASNEKAIVGLALIAEKSGDALKAVSLLEQSIKDNPKVLMPRIILGRYYVKNKKLNEALEVAEKLAQYHANNIDAMSVLVQIQLVTNRYSQALTTSEAIVKKWPNLPTGYIELGRSQLALKHYHAAEKALLKAIQIKPGLLSAQTALASVHLTNGKTAKAVEIAKQIKRQHPDQLIGYIILGDIYFSAKQYKNAQSEYRVVYEKNPSSSILLKLATAMEHGGETQRASEVLESWLRRYNHDNDVRMKSASVLTKLGQTKKAAEQYNLVLSNDPNSIAALNNLAILMLAEDSKLSLSYAEKAYKANPNMVEIGDTYGWVLLTTGEKAKALSLLSEAAGKSTNPSIQYHYAVALVKNMQHAKAKTILKSLIEKNFEESSEAKKLYNTL